MASKIFKTFIPAIYRGVRKVIQWTRANVEMEPTTYDGDVNIKIKPELRDDGVAFNVQAECQASVKKEVIVCGRTLELNASGNGQIDGKFHIVLKEKK